MNGINFVPRQLKLLLSSAAFCIVLSGCSDNDTPAAAAPTTPTPMTPAPATPVACASYTNADGDDLTAMAVPTAAVPNCVYEAAFVDNATPLTASITLDNLDDDGVHVFNGSLVVGAETPTLAGVPATAVVLTIEAGATIAFADAADRVIVNRGAQIEAVGTAAAPITFTSLADVVALASADTTDDLAADAVNQWSGITINGLALNNACIYSDPDAGAARRPFAADDPFTLADDTQPDLTAEPTTATPPVETCSEGAAVFTAGATDTDDPTLADGFHGGTSLADDSGELAYVIIKHVGDAVAGMNRNALHLSSVGSATTLSNIEVYSVDGSGIWVDGGGADLNNVLVYNPQEQGVLATGGYLGLLDGVLVSQAEGAGEACVQVEAGTGGMSEAQIVDGMNTRVTARNLTCDVSADNAGGAGVVVTEGARARIQNAIIVGSRVAANATPSTDNVCLQLVGTRSFIEADGVIASCLEASAVVTAANFLGIAAGVGAQVIATDADATSPTAEEVAMDIQFHDPESATTISPLLGTDPELVTLSDAGTLEIRALFSPLLSASMVDGAATTVVASSAGTTDRAYLGAINDVAGNNPFSGWTFGVFGTPPMPMVTCASYTDANDADLTAAARTAAAPNCVYGADFVDNDVPITASLTLSNLDLGGVHLFSGSLVVGAESATLADVSTTPVVLTIAAGATIAFADAADRVIINRGAQIEAVGTAAAPITFTSLADVVALATVTTTDDLAADAVNQWAGITINGQALNNACTYSDPDAGAARRPFATDAPYTLDAMQPTLMATTCSEGAAVLTAAATVGDDPTLDDGFHGGISPADNSGSLDFVIIKHVGDATANIDRNALNLRSVGSATTLSNIEVYSVDGSGIRVDGGGADLSNVLVYNAQAQGVLATGGYLGLLDTVLVSQADGTGTACVQVVSGDGGDEVDEITDGMNTRVTARNLTCDVSADNAGGAGVNVLEGARARIQNAIIVGSRVAASDTTGTDNLCLNLAGTLSIIEADGVIASCLEDSANVTAANFLATGTLGDRVIATDATTPTMEEVAMDIQFHVPGAADTISPLSGTDTELVVLLAMDTADRALFSELLSVYVVNDAPATVVVSGAGDSARTYLGAINNGAGNNPFFGWTFGIFEASP